MGEFIRLWTSREGRWTSPKFLIGESYGTTGPPPSPVTCKMRHGLFLNGILLISVVLNFQTLDFSHGNDLPHILFLPTFRHGLVSQPPGRGLPTISAPPWTRWKSSPPGRTPWPSSRGSSLPADKRAEVVHPTSRFTGLSPDYVERTNLRIDIFRFIKELLRDQRRTVGHLDGQLPGHGPGRRRGTDRVQSQLFGHPGLSPRSSTTICAENSNSRAMCTTKS